MLSVLKFSEVKPRSLDEDPDDPKLINARKQKEKHLKGEERARARPLWRRRQSGEEHRVPPRCSRLGA